MNKQRTRTQQMVEALHDLKAESIRATPALMPMYQERAAALAKPEHQPEIGGGEVLPAENENFIIRDRLADPDTTAVDASLTRTDLLQQTGALEIGLDAAATIRAKNSLEKMLVHQMAACHVNALRLIGETTDSRYSGVNAELLMVKKLNLAARLMDTYQKGMDTLTRTRAAGKQTIVVKHIQVNGGQNVITDNVTTGEREPGGEVKYYGITP